MQSSHASDDDRLPGSVSNQNNEEAEPGHGAGSHKPEQPKRHDGHDEEGGESKEGSQSTGDPRSAG